MNYLDNLEKYYFTYSEKLQLDLKSELRYKNTSSRTNDANQSKHDPQEIVKWGVYSEYAVCKTLKLFFDLNADYRTSFPLDIILPNGKTIDVKCTHWNSNTIHVRCNPRKQTPDFYVATKFREDNVFINEPDLSIVCEIIGWMDQKTFFENAIKRTNDDKSLHYKLGLCHFTQDIYALKTYIETLCSDK
jgi:hypothetical protein